MQVPMKAVLLLAWLVEPFIAILCSYILCDRAGLVLVLALLVASVEVLVAYCYWRPFRSCLSEYVCRTFSSLSSFLLVYSRAVAKIKNVIKITVRLSGVVGAGAGALDTHSALRHSVSYECPGGAVLLYHARTYSTYPYIFCQLGDRGLFCFQSQCTFLGSGAAVMDWTALKYDGEQSMVLLGVCSRLFTGLLCGVSTD